MDYDVMLPVLTEERDALMETVEKASARIAVIDRVIESITELKTGMFKPINGRPRVRRPQIHWAGIIRQKIADGQLPIDPVAVLSEYGRGNEGRSAFGTAIKQLGLVRVGKRQYDFPKGTNAKSEE